MIRTTTIILFLCTAWSATLADQPRSDDLWSLVAQSHIIVTGTLSVPVEQIRSCLASNQHEHVELTVNNSKLLKGSVPSRFAVRWYTKPEIYAPNADSVISLNNKNALLFLIHVGDDSVKGLYFAGYTPKALSDSDDKLLQQVREEISAQERILKQFEEIFPPVDEPLYKKVKSLIDATTQEKTQMDAFRQLEELGEKAVPAIIMLMDDRRDLAVPEISLQNPPVFFEGVRHYGPKKIVDAMSAILNQITGHSFGNIENGGTDRERQATVNGWRIYLYHLKKGAHNNTRESNKK